MDPLLGLGVLAFAGAAAAVAGWSEDLESVAGSQSNPNSQVQLAPQMARPHRLFNKAISGEPPSNALMAVIGGSIAYVMIVSGISSLFAIVAGSVIAAAFHAYLSLTAHLGRISGQSRFRQPVYVDVIISCLPAIASYAFLTTLCILIISLLTTQYLGNPFPFPLVALILGVTVGSVGSSVGDIYYGAERLYQSTEFGSGLNASGSGNIVRYGEAGIRSGHDNSWFCSKFGGPATGLTFAAVVVLSSWITLLFDPALGNRYGIFATITGVVLILIVFALNRALEKKAHRTFGPYREEKTEASE